MDTKVSNGRVTLRKKRLTNRRDRTILAITLVVNDALMVAVAMLLGWYLRISSGLLAYHAPSLPYTRFLMTMIAVITMICVFAFQKLYSYDTLLGGTREYGLVISSCTYGIIVLVLVSFLDRSQVVSRGWLLISWILTMSLVGLSRFFWRRFFLILRETRGWLITPIIIFGADEHARAIADQLTFRNSGIKLVGFVDEFLPVGSEVTLGKVVLGTPNQISELAYKHAIEKVIVVSNALSWETFRDIMEKAAVSNGFEIQLSPGFYEILTTNVRVTYKAYVPLLKIDQVRINGLDLVLKTAMDLSLGSFLLVLATPFVLVIALLLWLSKDRPIFIRYRVLGLRGEQFWTTKFRSLASNNSDNRMTNSEQLIQDENSQNRASWRIREFLFRTGMDKLPQLIDVVRGKMSLVGPRTQSSPGDVNLDSFPPSLLTVRPGWTGSWAVGGSSNPDEEMRLSLYYIRNWTIWVDLQILSQVFKLAFSKRSRLEKNK